MAKGFVNTALTGSTALTALLTGLATIIAVSNATIEVGATLTESWVDIGGLLVAIPGNEVAVGLVTVPASVVVDATLFWEEVSYSTTGG